jgi:hypothetical protein
MFLPNGLYLTTSYPPAAIRRRLGRGWRGAAGQGCSQRLIWHRSRCGRTSRPRPGLSRPRSRRDGRAGRAGRANDRHGDPRRAGGGGGGSRHSVPICHPTAGRPGGAHTGADHLERYKRCIRVSTRRSFYPESVSPVPVGLVRGQSRDDDKNVLTTTQ